MQWYHKCSNDNVLLGPSWSRIPICATFVINNSPTYSMLVSHQCVVFGRTFHKIPLPTLDTGRKKLTLLLKSPASFPLTLLILFGYFVYILTDMFIVVQAFHFKPSFYSLFEYFGHKQIKFIFLWMGYICHHWPRGKIISPEWGLARRVAPLYLRVKLSTPFNNVLPKWHAHYLFAQQNLSWNQGCT